MTNSSSPYKQLFDVEPQFWQFFRGLNIDDLLIELIQNDLDAGASRTLISFTEDRLICIGDGEPVGPSGWDRLRFILGAGGLVERKRYSIGVKNHGLKAAFRLGNEILVRSARRQTIQTLYQNGFDAPPSPGALEQPFLDDAAPETGCRVEIPYRREPLTVTTGEPLVLPPVTDAHLDQLFRHACEQFPARLLGIVRPGVRDAYILCLTHHSLGSVQLQWRAHRAVSHRGRNRKHYSIFRRSCTIESELPDLPNTPVLEQACMFRIALPSDSNRELPHFFSPSKRTFLADLSWSVDRNRKPQSAPGVRRYPIAYHPSNALALTGLGVNFSAPYVSDAERHAPTSVDELNTYIDGECTDALLETMASYLVPRHSGRAFALYIPDSHNPNHARLAELLERTLDRRAFPLRPNPPIARTRQRSASPEGRPRRQARLTRLGPRRTNTGTLRRIALPLFTWDTGRLSPLLSQLCSPSEDQIAADVPSPLLRLLASNSYDHIITFDEKAVLMRLRPLSSIPFFPWGAEAEWRRAFANPAVAKQYLDVVYQTRRRKSLDDEDTLIRTAYLPDRDCVARPLGSMYRAVDLPPALSRHESAPVLHHDVLAHPIFKVKEWKPANFTLADYLDKSDLSSASVADRKLFWRWLRATSRLLPASSLCRISHLPVWPDSLGRLVPLEELCQPSNARAVHLLDGFLQRPSSALLKLAGTVKNRRTRITIRSQPNKVEIARFLAKRLSTFPRSRPLTSDECRAFRDFEGHLGFLVRKFNPALRAELTGLSAEYAVALARDHWLKSPNEVVRLDRATSRMHLPARLLTERSDEILEDIVGWSTRQTATVAQLLDTFEEDAARIDAHVPRLQAYIKQAKVEGIAPTRLARVPCIPVNGRPLPPATLALRGSRNYWGAWKTNISVTGLNPEIQRLYKDVGVMGGEPTRESSRAFFLWLVQQGPRMVSRHVDQVLRHIGHRGGSTTWFLEDPALPFIPVEVDQDQVRLVTRVEATKYRSKIVVPDFDVLAEKVRRQQPPRCVDLAILSSDNVRQPIATLLRDIGLKTLTELAGAPLRVGGKTTAVVESDLLRTLDSLRKGKRGRQLNKRLEALDVDVRQVGLRNNWRERLGRIRSVSAASSVDATYRLGRRSCSVVVQQVFDERTGTLWLDAMGDRNELFFAGVADQIFESPKRYLGFVLERAYALDVREHSFLSDLEVEEEPDEKQKNARASSSSNGEPFATTARHPQPNRDPARNVPVPGPIPTAADGRRAERVRASGPRGATRVQTPEESAQIEEIKARQYAWHCQRCLGISAPGVLAPSASYVARYENRRHVMYAHHCDHVSAGGARHAGNLLLLCQYHHWELGDAFSRVDIVRALVKGRSHRLAFEVEGDGRSCSVEGRLVEVRLPQREGAISLYFTEPHARYWLAKGHEEGLM